MEARLKLTLAFMLCLSLQVKALDEERLADAIYLAEGGSKTRYPYGIKSVKTNNPRAVCLRTIRSALARWDGRGDFIAFLGKTYCPPSADPDGHRNWVRNTRKLYARKI